MKGYKGFNDKLQCTPNGKVFQFEVGKEYEEENAELCNSGFHFCENPFDIFGYYSPSDSRYCEIEADDVSEQTESDSKKCCKKIKISAEIKLSGIINAGVKFIMDKIDWKNSKESNTGDFSAATNTGDFSAATNTGCFSAATNTGDFSAATNMGYRSAATNTGNQSAATNTGNQSAATNTGYKSAATNTGDFSAATNTGNQSAATNTGYFSAATVEGNNSVAIATGHKSKAKAVKGSAIVVCEIDDNGNLLAIKSSVIDGELLKENTFYTLENGEFKEVE